MKKIFKIFTVGLLTVSFLFSVSQASLLLRQPSLRLSLNKGEIFNGGIALENLSDKPLTVKVQLADTLDDDGKPVSRACAKWIKLSENEFTIQPNSLKDLRLTIKVPENAEGGYWTGLVFSYSQGQIKGPEDMTFNINMHIEMPINVQIPNTIKNDIEIKNLEFVFDSSKENLAINTKVKNIGNSFFDLKPTFIVFNPDMTVKESFSLSAIKIYPNEEKNIFYDANLKIVKGSKVLSIFDIGNEKSRNIFREIKFN